MMIRERPHVVNPESPDVPRLVKKIDGPAKQYTDNFAIANHLK